MSDNEVKGKGLPATKVGGMRVPAHHDHGSNEGAIEAVPPKTAVAEGIGEGAVQVALTPTQIEEEKLALRDLSKDLEKMHNPPPKVPKVKDRGHKQPMQVYIQPNKLN